jgi:pimeloyl-ACP methyl ester carboxylesterase
LNYNLDRECEDIQAVMQATGATRLFGHSFGALLAMEMTVRAPDRLSCVIAYEPPLAIDGSLPDAFMPEFTAAVAANKPALALALLSRGLKVGGFTDRLPLFANRALNGVILTTIGRAMKANLTTVPREAAAGLALDGPPSRYAPSHVETLILVGQRSPAYFGAAARAVAGVMPGAELQILEGLDHNAPIIAARTVAPVIAAFAKAERPRIANTSVPGGAPQPTS